MIEKKSALVLCYLVMVLLVSGCARTPIISPVAPAPPALTPAQERISDWHRLLQEQRNSTTEQKLEQVNQFFNRLLFVDDIILWSQKDYWATPIEMLEHNGGDCEDFTIAKYFSLRTLQVPDSTLRLNYVKSLTLNQPHMVLSYYPYPQADPLILDNLTNDILPALQRSDLLPVYAFNGTDLWLSPGRDQWQHVGEPNRLLNRWQEMLRRMETEKNGNRPRFTQSRHGFD